MIRSELRRYRASPMAISAPTINLAQAISDQGSSRAPIRVHTFMAAKKTCASTIQPKPLREASDRGGRSEGGIGLDKVGAPAILGLK